MQFSFYISILVFITIALPAVWLSGCRGNIFDPSALVGKEKDESSKDVGPDPQLMQKYDEISDDMQDWQTSGKGTIMLKGRKSKEKKVCCCEL